MPYRPFRPLVLGALLLALALSCGCSHLPLATPLPEGVSAFRIGDHLAGAPFAASPDGRYVALVGDGLQLVESATGSRRQLHPGSPSALAWSPSGKSLSAAFPDGSGTVLAIFCPESGRQTVAKRVDGGIATLAWFNDLEVAAVALVLKRYTFGTNAATVLYRWDGESVPVAATLRDTTLRPSTAQNLARELLRPGMSAFSPAADELLFLHPHDPPLFTPYFKAILRNLTNNAERELPGVGLAAVAPVFDAVGETVSYGDTHAEWYDPWEERQAGPLPARGRTLAVSPWGGYLLIDGTLYHDGVRVLALEGGGAGRFSKDGKSLFVAAGGSLYRIDGLRDTPSTPQLTPEQAGRLRELRAWRAERLITPAEYRQAKERMLRP